MQQNDNYLDIHGQIFPFFLQPKTRGNSFKKLALLGRVFVCPYRNWDQRDKNYKIQGKIVKNTSVRAKLFK